MPSVTRRDFVKRTSLSIAALGALAGLRPIPALAEGSPQPNVGVQPMPAPLPIMPSPVLGGEPFVVYVSDPSSGAGTILVGERSIPFTNSAIVQTLSQAIG